MLTQLLSYTPRQLAQLPFAAVLSRVRQQAVAIAGVDMEEHGTAQLIDLQHAEGAVPLLHPAVAGAVEDEGGESRPVAVIVDLAFEAMVFAFLFVVVVIVESDISLRPHALHFPVVRPHQIHPAAVLPDPVVPLVLFVGEHGRGGLIPQSGGDGETAGAGADDDDVVDCVFFSFDLLIVSPCCCGKRRRMDWKDMTDCHCADLQQSEILLEELNRIELMNTAQRVQSSYILRRGDPQGSN